MHSLPESELPNYFRLKVIDSIKALALEYEEQLKLIPEKIQDALALELMDEWEIFYLDRSKQLQGKFETPVKDQLEKLDKMLQSIVDNDLLSKDDVKNHEKWGKIRLFSREILTLLNEENTPPESWLPG